MTTRWIDRLIGSTVLVPADFVSAIEISFKEGCYCWCLLLAVLSPITVPVCVVKCILDKNAYDKLVDMHVWGEGDTR